MVQQPDANLTNPDTCRPGVTALAGSTLETLGVASMVALIALFI